MIQKPAILFFACIFVNLSDRTDAAAQDKAKKERTGSVIGELKARKDAKNGMSVTLEILGVGEEKARVYLVAYNPRDPKAKAQFVELLAAINTAKLGDRVICHWVDTPAGSEGGLFVTAFEVLPKADAKR